METSSSSVESMGAPRAVPAKPSSSHLRSDALSLEVPIKVHGSRAPDVATGITQQTEPFEEQTGTMIVFPLGGVLKMATPVVPGQMLVLTNMKSRQDAICRVIKVRAYSTTQSYVEVEFTHRQPGYWGVYFPSDGPAIAGKLASPPAIEVEHVTKAAPEISWAPAPTSIVELPTPPNASAISTEASPAVVPAPPAISAVNPESTFIGIGSQEKVQLAASPTRDAKTFKPIEPEIPIAETFKSSRATLVPPPPAAAPALSSFSLEDLQGDHFAPPADSATARAVPQAREEVAVPATPAYSAASPSTFGTFAGGAILHGGNPVSGEAAGLSLPSVGSSATRAPEPRSNWMLITASVAILSAALTGGAVYFRQGIMGVFSGNANPAASVPPRAANLNAAPPAPAQPAAISNANSGASLNSAASPRSSTGASPATKSPVAPVAAAKGTRPVVLVQSEQSTPARPASAVTPRMLARTLNAHPVLSQPTSLSGDAAAPDVQSASGNESGALTGIAVSSNVPALPAPDLQPSGPMRVGGVVSQPRLVSSVLPIYPIGAKSANVEGDVVVNIVIDKSGNVTETHVLSGPGLLRQAATAALRRWKYEPSKLDGQPISVQMQVTVQFHR